MAWSVKHCDGIRTD